ncbi:MAG: BlaI/MecI/CopY family transcriptional regulator [Odoribacter sp.]|nr:BlaI/MecI/CopY family transcriptional regulator [Odoribacter sp.]
MKAGRKPQALTEKEAFIMKLLWQHGKMAVKDMLPFYPEPMPHYNTVATTVRILEDKGYVSHEADGQGHKFFATADIRDFRRRSLSAVIRDYFNNSYSGVVSALIEEEKLSVDDLRDIIRMIEDRNPEKS